MARKKTINLVSIIAIIAGILILVWPDILSIAIGIYLIIIGLIGVFDKD